MEFTGHPANPCSKVSQSEQTFSSTPPSAFATSRLDSKYSPAAHHRSSKLETSLPTSWSSPPRQDLTYDFTDFWTPWAGASKHSPAIQRRLQKLETSLPTSWSSPPQQNQTYDFTNFWTPWAQHSTREADSTSEPNILLFSTH